MGLLHGEEIYYKLTGTRVDIQGRINVIRLSQVIFTLPLAYRPLTTQTRMVISATSPLRLVIAASGNVTVDAQGISNPPSGTTDISYVDLTSNFDISINA